MKRITSSVAITALTFFLLFNAHSQEIISLPVTLKTGFGNLPASFGMIRMSTSPDEAMMKKLSGLPDWSKLTIKEIIFDFKQFQSRSEKPVKCFAYTVLGEDKSGIIKYKIDSDNDLDFGDEREFEIITLEKKHWTALDSLIQKLAVNVHYEAFRNSTLTEFFAPVLIVKNQNYILQNIPQHAEAILDGQKIIISSGFISTDYSDSNLQLAINPVFGKNTQMIHVNEYLSINGKSYQNLGVDINKQVLKLRTIAGNEIVYSSQPGFFAKDFTANEFTTNQPVALSDYAGKYVFVEFWGTWCGPCVGELPNLRKVYSELDHAKIEFLGIAKDEPGSLRKFLDKEPIAWKQILCETEHTGIIADYNITGYPTSFLIDPKGKIVAKNLRGEHLSDSLNHYINRKP